MAVKKYLPFFFYKETNPN